MTELQPLMVYLAGPVDGITEAEARDWRADVASDYPNVLFFLPDTAFANVNRTNAQLMNHMNHHAINCSHATLANLSGPGTGFGTVREIEFAAARGRFVVVVDELGRLDKTILVHDLTVVKSMDEGMHKILEWHAEMANQPAMFMGIPMTQFREIQPGDEGQEHGHDD